MIVDLGEEPSNKTAGFKVTANLYSEQENDYVANWHGGNFNTYDEAYEFWDSWNPSSCEVMNIMKQRREYGDYSHHEIEIGIWSNDPEEDHELAFANETVDGEHERSIDVNV